MSNFLITVKIMCLGLCMHKIRLPTIRLYLKKKAKSPHIKNDGYLSPGYFYFVFFCFVSISLNAAV